MSFQRGHALVIGVGTYVHTPRLNVPITVSDARALLEVLQDSEYCGYPPEQVRLLHDDTATRDSVLTALDELARRTTPDDTIFLFYCGHGDFDAERNYYLTTHDTRIEDRRVVRGTGVSHQELLERLKALPSRRALLIFNACHAGAISPTLGSTDEAGEAIGRNLPDEATGALLGTGEGRIIITASRGSQRSYIGRGPLTIFTQALVDALCGVGTSSQRGYISAFDLYSAVYESVNRTVSTLLHQMETQEPELTIHKGIGPFAVSLYRGSTALGTEVELARPDSLPATTREVSTEESQRLYEQLRYGGVNIGAGSTQVGGDIVGGDKVVRGDAAGRDVIKPQNTFNISGTVSGGVVNVGGQQTFERGVTVDMSSKSISSSLPDALDAARQGRSEATADSTQSLSTLIEELSALLEQVPPEQRAEAATVAKRLAAITAEMVKREPDRELLEFNAHSLERAAAKVADAVPGVLTLAARIVSQIQTLPI